MKKSIVLSLFLLNLSSVLAFANSDQNQYSQPIPEVLLNSSYGVYQGHHSGTNGGICTVEFKIVNGQITSQISSTLPFRQYIKGYLVELTDPVSTTPMSLLNFLNQTKGSFLDEESASFGNSIDHSNIQNNINQSLRLQYFKNALNVIELSYVEINRQQVYGPRVKEYSVQCTNLVKIQ